MSHDVFVSYCTADKALANAVCARLEASKHRCWIAPRDVIPGADYADSILGAISECRLFVLVFSSNANASPHVRRELERAVSKGKLILPIRTEDVLPSGLFEYCLSTTHWLDAITPPIEEHLDELLETVSLVLSGKADGNSHLAKQYRPQLRQMAQQWGWMVILAFGFAAFVHVSSKASAFTDEKYRKVIDLIEDPMAPLGLDISLPDKLQCDVNSVSRVGHRIEAELAKNDLRLANAFSFLWRTSLILGATDDGPASTRPEQEKLAAALTEAATDACLFDDFCKTLVDELAYSTLGPGRKTQLRERFESWAFEKSHS